MGSIPGKIGTAILAAAGWLFGAAPASGQTVVPSPLAFEVASIKPSEPLTNEDFRAARFRSGVTIDAARLDLGRYDLARLIATAYRVKDGQVSCATWLFLSPFDIVAKLPDGASVDQIPEMLQSLLAERFHLKLHSTSRTMPVYALVAGKNTARLALSITGGDAASRTHSKPMTMEAYARLLSEVLDRPVVDLTGLRGEFPIDAESQFGDVAKMRSLFEYRSKSAIGMLQKLGLKLRATRARMPVLVVDHIDDMPTED